MGEQFERWSAGVQQGSSGVASGVAAAEGGACASVGCKQRSAHQHTDWWWILSLIMYCDIFLREDPCMYWVSLRIASRPPTAAHQFPRLSIGFALPPRTFQLKRWHLHTPWEVCPTGKVETCRQRVDADRSASPEFQWHARPVRVSLTLRLFWSHQGLNPHRQAKND